MGAVEHCDVAVIGGGIVGLACAWAARRRGLSVVLLDRNVRQIGASIRNFGMLWPIGQPPGPALHRALRTREYWLEAARLAGFWYEATGSLHVAHHVDEMGVLEEFVSMGKSTGYRVKMLTPEQSLERSPWLAREGLKGAMWSETEVCVEPRRAIWAMSDYLSALGVRARFGAAVRAVDPPLVHLADRETVRAERICICTGEDMRLLYPEVYATSGLTLCKLQMMRTPAQPGGGRMGPMLAAGSTLRHYRSFESCASLAHVRARFTAERPEFDRWGIHVMASQTPAGELTIGDSHEYGDPVLPFMRESIDRLVLDYLATFLRPPETRIAERWFGVYPKSTTGATEFVATPHPAVRVVNGVGGAGMTLSFGLAEDVFTNWMG